MYSKKVKFVENIKFLCDLIQERETFVYSLFIKLKVKYLVPIFGLISQFMAFSSI